MGLTKEYLIAEAKKYNSRKELIEHNNSVYNAIKNRKLQPVAFAHMVKRVKLTTETFIQRSVVKHGDLYNYSKVDYKTNNDKVKIICASHGMFEQRAADHLSGTGCPKCAYGTMTKSDFINKAQKKHNNLYSYDKCNYINTYTKVEIYCKEHGSFWQLPSSHLKGHNCPDCALINRTLSTNDYIRLCNEKHNFSYDYSKTVYKKASCKVDIICKEHGLFSIEAYAHLKGQGCSKCGKENMALLQSHTQEIVIADFIKTHGKTYDYSNVKYLNNREKVDIVCKEHGLFSQEPMAHKFGKGCPKCANLVSNPEIEIAEFIKSKGFDVKQNIRGLFENPRFEADIVIESKKIIIEYDGNHWHSERMNPNKFNVRDKTLMANKAGYRCIHIREDQYIENPELIKSLLCSALGLFENRIGARQTEKREITQLEYRAICQNHLQGYRHAKHKKGLYYNGVLVAAISYNDTGELVRYIVKNNWQVIGALPKLLKDEMVTFSFCDLTFFDGAGYKKAGFKLDYITKPNYRYMKGQRTVSRQVMMKHKLKNKLAVFDENLTSKSKSRN